MEEHSDEETGEYYFEKNDINLKAFLLTIINIAYCKVCVFFQHQTATEEERLELMNEMLDNTAFTEEELFEIVPLVDAKNYFNMYNKKECDENEYAITEKNYMELTNSIINHIVYGMYNKLVDEGFAELVVDSDGNMVYRMKATPNAE